MNYDNIEVREIRIREMCIQKGESIVGNIGQYAINRFDYYLGSFTTISGVRYEQPTNILDGYFSSEKAKKDIRVEWERHNDYLYVTLKWKYPVTFKDKGDFDRIYFTTNDPEIIQHITDKLKAKINENI